MYTAICFTGCTDIQPRLVTRDVKDDGKYFVSRLIDRVFNFSYIFLPHGCSSCGAQKICAFLKTATRPSYRKGCNQKQTYDALDDD